MLFIIKTSAPKEAREWNFVTLHLLEFQRKPLDESGARYIYEVEMQFQTRVIHAQGFERRGANFCACDNHI